MHKGTAGYLHFSLRLMERYGLFITEEQWVELYKCEGIKKFESRNGKRIIMKVKIKDRWVIIAKNTKREYVATALPSYWKMSESEKTNSK